MRTKKNKFNKELLNEEIKKFQTLTDYDESEGIIKEFNFHVSEDFYETEEEKEDNLILGDKIFSEADGEEEDADAELDAAADELVGDEGADDGADEEELDLDGGEEELDLDGGGEEDMGDGEAPMGDEEELDLDMGDEDMEDMEDGGDEVEVDVTELVNSAEEAKQASELANQNMETLMGQFGQLQTQLQKMETLGTKIDDLEHEMETRMPTPEEKLEMRSLDSYPYNVKLTDYWADKEGAYDVMDGESENGGKPQEYVLTQNDVDTEYNEQSVKQSMDNPLEENPYDEEEI